MSRNPIRQLTVEILTELNKVVTGKPPVLVKPTELKSALDRPGNLAHYVPTSTEPERAASLAFGLIANHPFQDGNKRTAEGAVNEYLKARGLKPLPPPNDSLGKKIIAAHLAIASKKDDKHDENLQTELAKLYREAVERK